MSRRTLAFFQALVAALALLFYAHGWAQPAAAAFEVQPRYAPPPAPEQPLPFSHKTHVGMGVQCQTCHTNPAPGHQMTFPATSTCMTCHASMATERPAIKKLTDYSNANQAIPWVRVYKVLPAVTWTHDKHLKSGLQCQTCHGPVGELTAMSQQTSVTGMASCGSCHEARGAKATCATCHAWPAK